MPPLASSHRAAQDISMMRVEQVMSDRVFVCRSSDDASVAAAIMWNHDCGAVPVVDHAGLLVGIVTDRDLCMASYTRGQPLHAIPVGSVMGMSVHAARATDSVAEVEALMARHQVRRIPVIDTAGRPIGMVSVIDLARQALRIGPAMPERLRGVIRALVALCERTAVDVRAA
jgi:CBS domain-containing protein